MEPNWYKQDRKCISCYEATMSMSDSTVCR